MSYHYIALAPEQWQEKVRDLRNIYVLKYHKIIQALFYLLQYQTREDICERGTNKLLWKKAKIFINDELFSKMGEYWPNGPKEDTFKEYEKLKYIQDCISSYDEKEVEAYSLALGKLREWIQQAIDLRTMNVKQRRDQKEALQRQR